MDVAGSIPSAAIGYVSVTDPLFFFLQLIPLNLAFPIISLISFFFISRPRAFRTLRHAVSPETVHLMPTSLSD